MYDQGAQALSTQIQEFVQWVFPQGNFSPKVFCRLKTGKVDCNLKMVQ